MKRLLFIAIIILMSIDSVDAQMMFEPMRSNSDNTILSTLDNDELAKRRRKKRRKKGRRGGRGSDLSLLVGGSFGLGLPFGDLGKQVNMGFGGGVEGMYFVQPALGVGLSTGYYSFGYKDDFGSGGSLSLVPVLAQGWYLFGDSEFKPYAGMGLGLYFENAYFENTFKAVVGFDPFTFEPIYEDVTVKESNSQTNFGLAPLAGFMYELSDNLLLNFNLKYNMYFTKIEEINSDFTISEVSTTYSYMGINIGVVYNIQ